MFKQKVKYRGSYSYNPVTRQGRYILFDFINNKSFPFVLVNQTTEEELINKYGKAQREYYIKYPRFLPKGINVSNDINYNFQLHLLGLDREPIFIGKYITIQEAILAKKSIIALNIE